MAKVNTDKRKIIHVELGGKHYYFGSVAAVCQTFGPAAIGVGYNSLVYNLWKLRKDKPTGTIEFTTDECVIREGEIITSPKKQAEKKADSAKRR